MTMWLVSSSWRRPALSISVAASRVPATLTDPTMMLPRTGESRPAFAKTCPNIYTCFQRKSRSSFQPLASIF